MVGKRKERKSKGSYLKLFQVLACWNVWINCYRIGKLCIKRSFRCTCVKIYTPTGKKAFQNKYLFWLRIRRVMRVQIFAKHLTDELEDDTFFCVCMYLYPLSVQNNYSAFLVFFGNLSDLGWPLNYIFIHLFGVLFIHSKIFMACLLVLRTGVMTVDMTKPGSFAQRP